MSNIYIKAAALTLVIFLIGIGFVSYLESEKFKSTQERIEDVLLDMESTKLLFLYSKTMPDSKAFCSTLDSKISAQLEKTRGLVGDLEEARKSSLFTNLELLKKRYLLTNAELYIYLKEANNTCNNSQTVPVLYFYTDKSYFGEDEIVGKVLDSVAAECRNVRVFAFPIDSGLEIVNLMAAQFGISKSPAVVINEQKILKGPVGKDEILGNLNCSKS